MTLEKAIRLARKWAAGHVCTLKEGEAQEYHQMCAEALERSRLIPVTERLPLDGWHLTFGPQRTYEVLYYDSYDKEWSDIDDNEIEVTHWMPLPSTEGLK